MELPFCYLNMGKDFWEYWKTSSMHLEISKVTRQKTFRIWWYPTTTHHTYMCSNFWKEFEATYRLALQLTLGFCISKNITRHFCGQITSSPVQNHQSCTFLHGSWCLKVLSPYVWYYVPAGTQTHCKPIQPFLGSFSIFIMLFLHRNRHCLEKHFSDPLLCSIP